MKIFDLDFRKGTLIDSVSKTAGTLTAGSGGFKKTEKGLAMEFDGSATKLVFPSDVTMVDGSSVFFDIKCSDFSNYPTFFGKDGMGNNYIRFEPNNTIRVFSDSANIIFAKMFKENIRYFIEIKFNGSLIDLYVDGLYVESQSWSSAYTLKFNTLSTGYSGRWLKGYIGKVLIESGVNATRRNELYKEFLNSSPTEKPVRGFEYPKPTDLSYESGLVAAYSFSPETISNGTLLDISGNGNHGTINGALLTKDGMKFDGTSSITTPSVTLGTVYTLAYRGKFTSTANQVLITDNSYHHRLTSNTAFTIYTGTSAINLTIPDIAGKEVDIVFVRNGTDIRVYVNGILAITGTNPDNNSFKFNRLFGLSSSQRFDGTMIDNKIYNYAFTPQQAKDYHNSFVKPVIVEDFSNYAVRDVSPKGWVKGTGSFIIGEDVNGKYLQCTSNGTIIIPADLDSFKDNGYIEIDRWDGVSWTTHKSTVDALKALSWFDYSNKKITLTGTTLDRFTNFNIYNGVKL